jgi:hypothetical protein
MSERQRPRWQYDSTALIESIQPPDAPRRIGVVVGWPLPHLVPVEREMALVAGAKPVLSTIGHGKWVPDDSARDAWIDATTQVLADVDALIAELQQHRERLTQLLAEEGNHG